METIDLKPVDRAMEVRKRIAQVSDEVKDSYIEIAELLYEAWENDYHKQYGYSAFNDFIEKETDIKPRKAQFLIQICKKMKVLGIEWDEVRSVGWRKMATIAPILTTENYKEWVEEAKNCTQRELSPKVQAERNSKEETEPPVRITVHISEEENSIVQSAVEHARKNDSIKNTSQAIAHICYDWLTHQGDF